MTLSEASALVLYILFGNNYTQSTASSSLLFILDIIYVLVWAITSSKPDVQSWRFCSVHFELPS